MEDIHNRISVKHEIYRKLIHLSSSVIPISYFYFDRNTLIIILCIISLIMMAIDLVRSRSGRFKNFYLKNLGPVLRNFEVDNAKNIFTGGTYLVLAYLACVFLFPQALAITAMFVIIFSDSLAAIVGRSFGKRFIGNKTIEGSAAFLIAGILVILLAPKITGLKAEYFVGFVSIIITAVFELIPNKIDDNVSIPLFFLVLHISLC